MRTHRAKAGFSLVELMIVVAVIGVGSALSSAGVADAFSEMRATRAALELVRVGRRAKAEASGYMRAHMVWIQPTANRISLIRGTGWSCTNENWQAQFTAAACATATAPCIEQIDFDEGRYSSDAHPVQLDFVSLGVFAQTDTALCYGPNGLMFSAQPPGGSLAAVVPPLLTQQNTGNGGFLFSVRRMEGGNPYGVTRWVLFPQGAPALVLR